MRANLEQQALLPEGATLVSLGHGHEFGQFHGWLHHLSTGAAEVAVMDPTRQTLTLLLPPGRVQRPGRAVALQRALNSGFRPYTNADTPATAARARTRCAWKWRWHRPLATAAANHHLGLARSSGSGRRLGVNGATLAGLAGPRRFAPPAAFCATDFMNAWAGRNAVSAAAPSQTFSA